MTLWRHHLGTGRLRAAIRPGLGLALALLLVWGVSLGWGIHQDLKDVGKARRVWEILRAFHYRLDSVEEGLERMRPGQVPQELFARLLDRREDLQALTQEARGLLRGDPEALQVLDHLALEINQDLDAAREIVLLQVQTDLARTEGKEDQARALEERSAPLRETLAAEQLRITPSMAYLEQHSAGVLKRAARSGQVVDLLLLGALILFTLLVGQLWRQQKQRGRQLRGARLVQEMLEAYGRRLEAMNEELERTNLLKAEILAHTSEELLTPLGSIQRALEVIRDRAAPSPGEDGQPLEQAFQSAGHLQGLIRRLLDLCNAEKISVSEQSRGIASGVLIERALARHRGAIEGRGLALLVIPPAEGWPRIQADSDRLDQILQNLLSNACKFTKTGSIRVTGRIERVPKEFLRLEVSDTGIGIEPAEIPLVFDLLRLADGSGSGHGEGTGLGLILSRHLIQSMGGSIGIESEGAGCGTRVWLTLPLARPQDGEDAGERSSPAGPERRAA